MRRGPEHFGETELSLLYVAQKLKHALRLEQLLTDAGLDYLVETDEYSVGILFRRVRVGPSSTWRRTTTAPHGTCSVAAGSDRRTRGPSGHDGADDTGYDRVSGLPVHHHVNCR